MKRLRPEEIETVIIDTVFEGLQKHGFRAEKDSFGDRRNNPIFLCKHRRNIHGQIPPEEQTAFAR